MFKSVFKIDFATSEEATNLFCDCLKQGMNVLEAREEVRKPYGFGTVYVVATTEEKARAKFSNKFPNDFAMIVECVICGGVI